MLSMCRLTVSASVVDVIRRDRGSNLIYCFYGKHKILRRRGRLPITTIWCPLSRQGGNTLLHHVTSCNPTHIYVLANNGVPVNIQNNVGDTALHLAVRANNFDCTEALIQCSADLSIRNEMGQLPVDEAEGSLKELLEKFQPEPLQAVLTGNASVLLKHLRQNWCSVNSIVKCGVVAALENGRFKLLSHLVRTTWASTTTIVKGGKNLLQLAVELAERKPEITNCCRILQDYKNTNELIHAVLAEDTKKLEEFLQIHHGYCINTRFRDKYGKTLLSHAIDSNNYAMVRLLVSAGSRVNQIRVRVNEQSKETVPLFFKALKMDIDPGIPQFLYSVQEDSEMMEKDENGNTALLRAVENGTSNQIIKWLLATQNGLNVCQRNKDSLNARELAKSRGRLDVVALIDNFILQQQKKFFLVNLPVHFYGLENLQFVDEHSGKSFIDLVAESKDEDDYKSLKHYKAIENKAVTLFEAAARGDLEQVQQLSVADFQDKNGYTALIRAIVFNQPDVANFLCTSRPLLKFIPDNCNRYPLHYACALPLGQDEIFIRILLEKDPELIEKKMDKDGHFPVEYSNMRGSKEIRQMLYDARTLDAYGVVFTGAMATGCRH
ncbi:uncharacterized protein LOC112558479 isoform X2 [Pomacea canaliculata]|uniref:uncharacterized protein LOC112558479 isoform X2 n=1 Tax=Pomacea canaliculata TaxID=400727 RepID=UPI000D73B24B|nr:uncharacterized protein LOC112558479 isoform X2 [Pomacea canaliculata]